MLCVCVREREREIACVVVVVVADMLSGVAVGHATTHVVATHAWAVATQQHQCSSHSASLCKHTYIHTKCGGKLTLLCVGCVSMHACMHHMAVWWQCGGVARLHACMVVMVMVMVAHA